LFEVTTPFVLVGVVALLILAAVTNRLRSGHLVAVAIFSIYLVGAAHFLILPLQHNPEFAAQVFPSEPIPLERMVNLTPFFLGGDALSFEQLLYNVVVTVPFGFGLAFVRRMGIASTLAVSLLFAAAIEAAQLLANVLRAAIPNWSIDINDVILNSLGAVIGVAAFLLVGRVYRVMAPYVRFRLGPLEHFHATLVRGYDAAPLDFGGRDSR
jgi:glycopeptide antibiotics resistance protein